MTNNENIEPKNKTNENKNPSEQEQQTTNQKDAQTPFDESRTTKFLKKTKEVLDSDSLKLPWENKGKD